MDRIPTLVDYYDIVPQEKHAPVKYKQLSREYLEYIRTLLRAGKTVRQVADETNVSYHRVWSIKNKLSYEE
jgi:DNA invertase Pin-like site-specific DNA recombinase